MRKKKQSALTLLEIMIVIFLIGLIGSVIGYNVKGSLEEGKAFRSEQGASQIEDILSLAASEGTPLEEIVDDPEFFLRQSGLCKEPAKLLKDGWGRPYEISLSKDGSEISVVSRSLQEHLKKKQASEKKHAKKTS